MNITRSPAVAIVGILAFVGLSGSVALAQTPAADKNPPVANCNTTPDTNQPAMPRLPTPVDAKLLTSGQPCQQVVSTHGLVLDSVPGSGLPNLQRGFDFYSWLTFLAMNSPADGKTIGQGPRPGGDAQTKWEDLGNYRPLADVMLAKGEKPVWGTRRVPDACKPFDGPGKIVFQIGEEAFNQPFKSGPLIDQDGNFALFDILMNHPMFDYISEHTLYSVSGQRNFGGVVEFPSGISPAGSAPGRMGAIMLKVSYRILDRVKNKDLLDKFHTSEALIYFPGLPATKTGPVCVEKTLGLVGFHVGHKTEGAPQWVWSSFEHVSNAPDAASVASGKLLPAYNFYKAGCKTCVVNDTPPQPWDPEASLKFPTAYRSQVVREMMLPKPVLDEVAKLNQDFHAILKGTVWENYELLATQWPSDFACTHQKDPKKITDPNCSPAPTFLANTTLETYSQGGVPPVKGNIPLATSSCMACHGNATTHHVPASASDFTFILEKAQ